MTEAESVNREFWGVDGCAAGWIVARKKQPEAGVDFAVYPDWRTLISQAEGRNAIIAVDMPIGLVSRGRRRCDQLARRQLGRARASSIFAPPRRPMLAFSKYTDANEWGKAQGLAHGGGLSKQAWNLIPKIKQIDDWIDPAKQLHVREAHPELAFQILNDGTCPPAKRLSEGQSMRRTLLKQKGVLGHIPLPDKAPSGAQMNDLLDAAVLAWVAVKIANNSATCFSGTPVEDDSGLSMEIYC